MCSVIVVPYISQYLISGYEYHRAYGLSKFQSIYIDYVFMNANLKGLKVCLLL
jgi:hypothetical protein